MKIQILGLAAAGLMASACAPVETDTAPAPPDNGASQCRADQYATSAATGQNCRRGRPMRRGA